MHRHVIWIATETLLPCLTGRVRERVSRDDAGVVWRSSLTPSDRNASSRQRIYHTLPGVGNTHVPGIWMPSAMPISPCEPSEHGPTRPGLLPESRRTSRDTSRMRPATWQTTHCRSVRFRVAVRCQERQLSSQPHRHRRHCLVPLILRAVLYQGDRPLGLGYDLMPCQFTRQSLDGA